MATTVIPAALVAQQRLLARQAQSLLDSGATYAPATRRELEQIAAQGRDVVEVSSGRTNAPKAPAYSEAERQRGSDLVLKLLRTSAQSRREGTGTLVEFSRQLVDGRTQGTWMNLSHLVSDLARNETVVLTVTTAGSSATPRHLEVRGLDGLFEAARSLGV
jgi:hypothetical protein